MSIDLSGNNETAPVQLERRGLTQIQTLNSEQVRLSGGGLEGRGQRDSP